MTVRELREKYLKFFESKGHSVHPSGSLVPVDVTGRLDESLLFNGAGMIQFKPYFRGVAKPTNLRLTTAQKCVRTGDIDEVGNLAHLTFFEMLGNFSFGDYFKKEAIAYSWEFLTSPEWLGLDPNRLSFTVFEDDDEAYECWKEPPRPSASMPNIACFVLARKRNYWPAAPSPRAPRPCGPTRKCSDSGPSDSLLLLRASRAKGGGGRGWRFRILPRRLAPRRRGKNWLEIWNDVFIQFEMARASSKTPTAPGWSSKRPACRTCRSGPSTPAWALSAPPPSLATPKRL